MIDRLQDDIIRNWPKGWNVPVVSIQCITFNQERYIAQALDSFLMQETTFPFQVVVHDDASSDNTPNIIREYEAKYPLIIKPIYEVENQFSKHDGSLERVIEPCLKGEYVAFCEGDDYWIDSLKLQKQVDFLRSNLDYSMCFHRAKLKYEKDGLKCRLKCDDIENREYDPKEMLEKWIVPTASILMRRKCLDYEIKGPNRMLSGDIFIVLKSGAMGKIRGMSDCMSVYRVQENGVTYNQAAMRKRTMLYPLHFECILENFPGMATKQVKRNLSEAFFYRAMIQESVKDSVSDYVKSFVCSEYMFSVVLRRMIRKKIKSLLCKMHLVSG